MRNDYGTRPYKPRFVKNASKKNKVASKKNKNKKSQLMFKSVKKFICDIFHIKACKCNEDEHIELYTKVPEPEIPVHEEKQMHCGSHKYFRKSCPTCVAIIKG